MTLKDLAKYFLHGIAFSVLFLLLGIGWAVILLILVSLGFIIGLLIGLVLLFLIVGYLNSFITSLLWFEVKRGFWDLLFHGVVLFIILLIVNAIFSLAPNLAVPGMATTVVSFIITSFLYGFVAKKVAGWWESEYRKGVPEVAEVEWANRKL